MRRFGIVLGLVLLVAGIGGGGYMASQDVKFFWGVDGTGFCLLKGGYRAWSVSWCDGYGLYLDSNKTFPVSYVTTGSTVTARKGYRWPRFRHLDMRTALQEMERLRQNGGPYDGR